MTDKEKRELKNGVISIFNRFNILDNTATIGGLKNDILKCINSLQEDPVSENLKEAAKQYGIDNFPSLCSGCKHVPVDAFKDGAKWQEKKDLETIETAIHHAYHNGRLEMKEQMMANATEVTVYIDEDDYPYIPRKVLYDYDKYIPLAKKGDKYKVVLIKED